MEGVGLKKMVTMMTLNDAKRVFSGRRALITGHTGFKGSWLTYMLQSFGCQTVGYSIAKPKNAKHCYYALEIEKGIINTESCLNDIRDFDRINSVINEYEPDFIFHLAAQPIVSISYQEPYRTFTTNTLGTLNVLETIRRYKKSVTSIIITSDKCYKNKERMDAYKENDEMGGDDPYSASKGASEILFHSYLHSYFMDSPGKGIVSVRAGNVFGGGDWSENRRIPECVRDIFSSGLVNVRMPDAIRPWTYVIDILYGYLSLAYRLSQDPNLYKGSWNFASGETKTVKEVVEIFIKAIGKGRIDINNKAMVGKESGLLLIDASKSRTRLGWKCALPLSDSLAMTSEWYSRQNAGDDMKKVSELFLMQYFERLGAL
jgi:CDP-glucose 4,6-dehydratase